MKKIIKGIGLLGLVAVLGTVSLTSKDSLAADYAFISGGKAEIEIDVKFNSWLGVTVEPSLGLVTDFSRVGPVVNLPIALKAFWSLEKITPYIKVGGTPIYKNNAFSFVGQTLIGVSWDINSHFGLKAETGLWYVGILDSVAVLFPGLSLDVYYKLTEELRVGVDAQIGPRGTLAMVAFTWAPQI